MMERKIIAVNRNCPARLVPTGIGITIPKDSFVTMTQELGNAYTVIINGNMARIDGTDADAIGRKPRYLEYADADPSGRVNMEDVLKTLKTIYDPEIPVNIIDLGLIYECRSEVHADGTVIVVKMTLTAPGCGMGPVIADDIRQRLERVPNVARVEVKMVFDPPWNRSMMSEEAQLELGLF